MSGRLRPRLIAAAAIVLAAAWGGALAAGHLAGRASVLDGLEAVTLDWRFQLRGPRPPPPEIALVAIDDATLAATGGFPVSRRTLASIVAAIAGAGPKLIGVDLLLLDQGPAEADAALAAALGRGPATIGAAALFPPGVALPAPAGVAALGPVPVAAAIAWPEAAFRAVAQAGVVNIAVDASGEPRHLPLLVATPQAVVPSFVLVAAAMAAGSQPRFGGDGVTLGERRQPLDLGAHLALDFYGPAGTIPTTSAADVLTGTEAAALAGKVVLLGTTALGAGDVFATPFDPNVPGVEVLATAVGNLVAGEGLVRDPAVRRIDAAATVLLPVLAVLAIALASPMLGIGLAGVLVAGWLAAAMAAFSAGYWLAVATPLAAALPAAALFGAARYALEHRVARRLAAARDALGHLLPRPIAARLAADPDFLHDPWQGEAAVMFLDLSGFTGVSERLGTARTRDFLNAFHVLVSAEAEAHGGLMIAFLGDGAMLVFGFPDTAPDAAERSLRAVDGLAAVLGRWIATVPEAAASGMIIRFGVNYGPVAMSRLGAAGHGHITATGDTVNVASRFQEIAKAAGAVATVSESAFAAVAPERRAAIAAGYGAPQPIAVRGRADAMVVRMKTAFGPPAGGPTTHAAGAATR